MGPKKNMKFFLNLTFSKLDINLFERINFNRVLLAVQNEQWLPSLLVAAAYKLFFFLSLDLHFVMHDYNGNLFYHSIFQSFKSLVILIKIIYHRLFIAVMFLY